VLEAKMRLLLAIVKKNAAGRIIISPKARVFLSGILSPGRRICSGQSYYIDMASENVMPVDTDSTSHVLARHSAREMTDTQRCG